MDEPRTKYIAGEEIIRLAREEGLSDHEIVRALTTGRTYRAAQEIARDYAPLLGLGLKEFMDLRRNE
jgi:hypothetical protein